MDLTSLTLENLDPLGEVSRNEHSRGLTLLKPLRTLEYWQALQLDTTRGEGWYEYQASESINQ